MYTLSPSKQDALWKAQQDFRRGNFHSSTIEWRLSCQENNGFYDGGNDAQWTKESLQILKERGQLPITVNIVQGFVDALSGVEIQSRYRTACRADSEKEDDEKLASALTHWLFHIQEDQKIPYKGSIKFRDMLVTGIGWSNQYKEHGVNHYEYVHPFNVVPDPDNLHPQYVGSKYVCRKRWMDPEKVRKLWPVVGKYIDINNVYSTEGVMSPELIDRQSSYTTVDNYAGYSFGRVLVIEVQRKIETRSYCGIDSNGNYFATFDEEKAEKMANSSKDIEEKKSERIMRTLFLDSFLLEHAPLTPDLPDLQDFSYIPCVWKRRFSTGVPYGIVEGIKDLQRDCNIRVTKSIYLINSSRIVVSGALQPGKSTELLRSELKRNDSVIVLPKDTNFELTSNAPLGKEQMEIVKEYLVLMQRITGVHDEMLGIQTNATSAVAQNVRQVNSVRNNVYGFDNFSDMKEREARFFLNLLQGGDEENILVKILTEEENQRIILNLVRKIDGKPMIFNDVRTLPVSLYIEEVPDYKSTFEEQKQMIQSLLSNQNANWIMLSPKLLEMMGIRDGEKISNEMKEAMQQKAMMEQGMMGAGQGGMSTEMMAAQQQSLGSQEQLIQ